MKKENAIKALSALLLCALLLSGCAKTLASETPLYFSIEEAQAGVNSVASISDLNGKYTLGKTLPGGVVEIKAVGQRDNALADSPIYYARIESSTETGGANFTANPVTQLLDQITPETTFVVSNIVFLIGFFGWAYVSYIGLRKFFEIFTRQRAFEMEIPPTTTEDDQQIEGWKATFTIVRNPNAAASIFWTDDALDEVIRLWAPVVLPDMQEVIRRSKKYTRAPEELAKFLQAMTAHSYNWPTTGALFVSARLTTHSFTVAQADSLSKVNEVKPAIQAALLLAEELHVSPETALEYLANQAEAEAKGNIAGSITALGKLLQVFTNKDK